MGYQNSVGSYLIYFVVITNGVPILTLAIFLFSGAFVEFIG